MARREYTEIERLLEQALSSDEANRPDLALPLYCQAEARILALIRSLNAPEDRGFVEKLDAYLANVLSRKESLLANSGKTFPSAPPLPAEPPYELLFRLSQPNVQLVTVSEECVSVPSYPDYLEVNVFKGPEGQPFLSLGKWKCPLIPGETPILLSGSDFSTLMLPDPSSLRPGDSVGILLPPDLAPNERKTLLHVLNRLSAIKVRDDVTGAVRPLTSLEMDGRPHRAGAQAPLRPPPPLPPPSPSVPEPVSGDTSTSSIPSRRSSGSEKIASAIAETSAQVAKTVQKGAVKGSEWVTKGSQALQARLARPDQADRPTDPRLSSGAAKFRQGSHVVAAGTEMAISAVAKAMRVAGRFAAPHVARGAKQVLPQSWTASNGEEPSKASKAWVVTSAAVAGALTVFEQLEQGAKVLGRSVATGTGGVVGARYGHSSGNVAQNIMFSAGNVGMITHNVKGFVKHAAATSVVEEAAARAERQKEQEMAPTGPANEVKKDQPGSVNGPKNW